MALVARQYRTSISIGARIVLWEVLLPRWVGEMRRTASDISILSEIGVEEDLMYRVIESTMDVALRYTPKHSPGIHVQHLFSESVVLDQVLDSLHAQAIIEKHNY
jgi:DNA-binding transcriptional LysR family regulator